MATKKFKSTDFPCQTELKQLLYRLDMYWLDYQSTKNNISILATDPIEQEKIINMLVNTQNWYEQQENIVGDPNMMIQTYRKLTKTKNWLNHQPFQSLT